MTGRWKKTVAVLLSATLLLTLCAGVLPGAACAASSKILKIGVTEDVDSLNPFVAYTMASYEVFLLTYDSLTEFDPDMNPVGALAESWEISDDHLSWTFHLRSGVTWHDGEPFTSADVKYTYDTLLSTGMGMYADQLSGIETVAAPDDLTVVITSTEPKANMLYLTAPILPAHIWSGMTEEELAEFDNAACVGTGAFIMVGWTNGDNTMLKANPGYFNGVSAFDGVVYKLYANTDTMAQSLKLGEINVTQNLTSVQAYNVAKENPAVTVYDSEMNSFEDLGFNCAASGDSLGSAALQNPAVRKAIDAAIDKQSVIDLAFSGDGIVGTTIVPPIEVPWHYEPAGDEYNAYDPETAAQMLADAGYATLGDDGMRVDADGNRLSLRLFARSDSSQEVRACEMIKSYLNAVGIEIELSSMDDDALLDKIYSMDYDMFVWGWGADVDPTVILNVLITDQIDNLSDTFYSNPDYDALVALQATQIDQAERLETVKQAQMLAYEEAPYSVLMYEKGFEAVNTGEITNLTQTCLGEGPLFFANTNYNYMHAGYAAQ